jgi:RNA polymerase sigma factor (sigma-70 family)
MAPDINQLYEAARDGNETAKRELFETLTDSFRLFAHHKVWNSEEAEDLVQEALAVVAAEYKSVAIQASFAAWAHKVMDNRLLGYIQKQRREKGRVAPDDSSGYLAASWTPNPSLRMRLLECLKKVGEANRRYARILNLHLIGFSRAEVCERLSLTRAQSYVVMSRARSMLKECLDTGGIAR